MICTVSLTKTKRQTLNGLFRDRTPQRFFSTVLGHFLRSAASRTFVSPDTKKAPLHEEPFWSWRSDLNRRPADYESAALPTEPLQLISFLLPGGGCLPVQFTAFLIISVFPPLVKRRLWVLPPFRTIFCRILPFLSRHGKRNFSYTIRRQNDRIVLQVFRTACPKQDIPARIWEDPYGNFRLSTA